MISIARLRRSVNIGVAVWVTALLVLGASLFITSPALAATADPVYTCGSYGGNAYNSCDTTINSSSATTGGTAEATSATPAASSTTAGNTIVNTNGKTGGGTTGKMSTGRKLLFGISFLFLLMALWWFILMFKRRKRKDDEHPPVETNLWK